MISKIRKELLVKEIKFKAIRSSGKGGQNVNKVSSKIELRFNLVDSEVFDNQEKEILLTKLSRYFNDDGVLVLFSDNERSQYLNKKDALERFFHLVNKALIVKKKRIKTKATRASKERKLKTKLLRSEIKTSRRKVDKSDLD